jgi:hypothetical protein
MCKKCTTPGSRILRHEQKNNDSYKHEIERVNQFKEKSRDDQHFRQLILNRAAKCGPDKRERFIETLRYMNREDLAGFVEMTMKQRGE